MNLGPTDDSLLADTSLRPGGRGVVCKMPAKSASHQLMTGWGRNKILHRANKDDGGMSGAWALPG